MTGLLFGQGLDLKAEFDFLKRLGLRLSNFAVNVRSDDNGVVLPLLEARIHLQGRDLNDPLAIELDNALVRPSYLVVFRTRHLETSHLDFVSHLVLLLFAEVFIGFEVTLQPKFVLCDVGNVVFSNHFLDFVEGVYKPHAAVVALNRLFALLFAGRLIQALEMERSVADRTQELLIIFLVSSASAVA